jgi:hypothetical protein
MLADSEADTLGHMSVGVIMDRKHKSATARVVLLNMRSGKIVSMK